jgi:hypothetical protein
VGVEERREGLTPRAQQALRNEVLYQAEPIPLRCAGKLIHLGARVAGVVHSSRQALSG